MYVADETRLGFLDRTQNQRRNSLLCMRDSVISSRISAMEVDICLVAWQRWHFPLVIAMLFYREVEKFPVSAFISVVILSYAACVPTKK